MGVYMFGLSAAAISGILLIHTGFPFTTVLILPSARLVLFLVCLFLHRRWTCTPLQGGRSLSCQPGRCWCRTLGWVSLRVYGARPLYDMGKCRFGTRNRMNRVVFVWTDYWEDTIQLVAATGASAWSFGVAIGSSPPVGSRRSLNE